MGSSLNDGPIPNNISLSGAMVGVVLIITGAFGNFLVIVSVIRNKHLCKAANAFIISLAVCDIFQNVAVKPLYVQTYMTGQWMHGRNVCLYALFASNLAILESVLHITAVAFFRYLVIVHPRIGQKIANWKAVLVILLFIFVMPIALTVITAASKMREGNVQFNKRIMFCSFVHHTDFKLGGVLKKVVIPVCGRSSDFIFIRKDLLQIKKHIQVSPQRQWGKFITATELQQGEKRPCPVEDCKNHLHHIRHQLSTLINPVRNRHY